MLHFCSAERCAIALALLVTLFDWRIVTAGERPRFRLLELHGVRVQWISKRAVAPVLTYASLTTTRRFPSAFNCQNMTAPDAMLERSHVTEASWKAEIRAAFDMWEAVADIRFIEAHDDSKPDILIGAQVTPTGRAFTNVDYDRTSREAVKPITSALICLNPAMPWKVGFDGDLSVYDLRYTLAHEIGHAIGLDHPTSSGQIMGFRYTEGFRDLQSGDIAGAQSLYGSRQLAQDIRP